MALDATFNPQLCEYEKKPSLTRERKVEKLYDHSLVSSLLTLCYSVCIYKHFLRTPNVLCWFNHGFYHSCSSIE